MKKKNIFQTIGLCLLVLVAVFTSCGSDARLDMIGMFAGTSPKIDERFKQSKEYNDTYGFAILKAPVDDYRVYVCTDTHVSKTRTRWEHFIATYRQDPICPVAVHLGDIIDAQKNFDFMFFCLNHSRTYRYFQQKFAQQHRKPIPKITATRTHPPPCHPNN
jgi:hypothetical protein